MRWDSILDSSLWEQRFEAGTYAGQVTEDDRTFETVDFPQREGVKTPCIFKVYFAEDLQYFPLKWVRRVEGTGKAASTVEVTRFKNIELDGASIVFPLEVQTSITGADQMALARTISLSIEEQSLVLNEDIEPSTFNIDLPPGFEIHDMDQLPSLPIGEELTEKPNRFRWVLLWGNLGFVALIITYIAVRQFQRRSAGKDQVDA